MPEPRTNGGIGRVRVETWFRGVLQRVLIHCGRCGGLTSGGHVFCPMCGIRFTAPTQEISEVAT